MQHLKPCQAERRVFDPLDRDEVQLQGQQPQAPRYEHETRAFLPESWPAHWVVKDLP